MKYKIDLLPEDFNGNSYMDSDCPLRRAIRRRFKTDETDVPCFGGFCVKYQQFNFSWDNWDYAIEARVRACYADPKHDTIYYVEVEGPKL